MLFIVVLGVLLNSYIRQVNEHVVELRDIGRVLFVTETSKAKRVEINFERAVGSNEYVDTQIKFLATDK